MADGMLRKIENGNAVSREEFQISCRSLIWLYGRNLGLNRQELQELLTSVVSALFGTEKILIHNGSCGRFRDCLRQTVCRNVKTILNQRAETGKAWLETRTPPENTDERK